MRREIRSLAAVGALYGLGGGGLLVGGVVAVVSPIAVVATAGVGLAALVVGVAGGIDAPGAGAPETEVSAMGSLHGDGGPLPGVAVGGSTLLAAVGAGTFLWSVVVTLLTV